MKSTKPVLRLLPPPVGSGGRMTLRINGSDHGKDSDSEQQAEKHNLCSLVTEQANARSRQIQRGGASEHSHRAKKDRRRLGPNVHVARPPFRERGNPNMGDPSLVTLSCVCRADIAPAGRLCYRADLD